MEDRKEKAELMGREGQGVDMLSAVFHQHFKSQRVKDGVIFLLPVACQEAGLASRPIQYVTLPVLTLGIRCIYFTLEDKL